jgi:NAD(P)H-hydrate epimerase
LTKIGCPKTTQPVIAQLVPEATSMPMPDVAQKGMFALRGLGEIKKAISEHDAVVIGPGIGLHYQTKELICRLLLGLDKPVVIDADGLNALIDNLQILEDTKADIVLTPHPGEFAKLTGVQPSNDIFERIESARKFAIEHQTVLVLKGSPTIVADISGVVYVNQTGNSGLATGGSGDVLSGIIGCLLSQQASPIDAALCGVFIHGLAGDFATDELGQRSMIASDIIDFLPEAFLSLE